MCVYVLENSRALSPILSGWGGGRPAGCDASPDECAKSNPPDPTGFWRFANHCSNSNIWIFRAPRMASNRSWWLFGWSKNSPINGHTCHMRFYRLVWTNGFLLNCFLPSKFDSFFNKFWFIVWVGNRFTTHIHACIQQRVCAIIIDDDALVLDEKSNNSHWIKFWKIGDFTQFNHTRPHHHHWLRGRVSMVWWWSREKIAHILLILFFAAMRWLCAMMMILQWLSNFPSRIGIHIVGIFGQMHLQSCIFVIRQQLYAFLLEVYCSASVLIALICF